MRRMRKIRREFKAKPTLEGAGVHLKRGFGFSEVPLFDPFLLLDDFRSDDPEQYLKGFPWHPHRGIETITYVLAGEVEHGDSLHNHGVIGSGDVQWMTAGSGIIHQEMPKGDENGRMHGFQLWANLPSGEKMMDPRYRDVKSTQIPRVDLPGGTVVKVIAGEISGTKGPVRDVVIDPEYIDVTVPAKSEFTHAITRGHSAFAYVIEGSGIFCGGQEPFSHDVVGSGRFDDDPGPSVGNGTVVLFEDGDEITVEADGNGMRFLLVSGRPLGEPVAWRGPVVMNTREELRTAFEEYEQGTFIKKSR